MMSASSGRASFAACERPLYLFVSPPANGVIEPMIRYCRRNLDLERYSGEVARYHRVVGGSTSRGWHGGKDKTPGQRRDSPPGTASIRWVSRPHGIGVSGANLSHRRPNATLPRPRRKAEAARFSAPPPPPMQMLSREASRRTPPHLHVTAPPGRGSAPARGR